MKIGSIMQQRWNHVFFIHSKVDPLLLQPHVPFELDLFEGNGVLSIVPFQMDKIRLLGFPPIPFFSQLWELNLRTYVTVGGVRGIYFFTLDTDSSLGCWIANRFFHLPYRLAKIEASINKHEYRFQSYRCPFSFSTRFQLTGKKKRASTFDRWTTERDRLFTIDQENIYEGCVLHDPWPLEEVSHVSIEDYFSTQLPFSCNFDLESTSYVRTLDVRFLPFRKIRTNWEVKTTTEAFQHGNAKSD
ncbi:MAG: YqjF family protein [Chthoniobacterales bacterium]